MARARHAVGLPTQLDVRVDDLVMACDLADYGMGTALQAVRGRDWLGSITRGFLGPGDSFIDIGANHGTYSLVAARTVGAEGRVLAFEPQAALAGLIRRSFERNGFSQATVHAVACSDAAGTTDLFIPNTDSGRAGLFPRISGTGAHRKETVPTTTLDTVVGSHELPGAVLVKIDVEGSEMNVLRGAQGFISERRPILVCELSPPMARAAGLATDAIISMLSELGYYRFADPAQPAVILGAAEVERQRQCDVVALP